MKRFFSVDFVAISIGEITMVLEIKGFGLFAPYFGNALAVSSNIIGIVLTSLAVGYVIGGYFADKDNFKEI